MSGEYFNKDIETMERGELDSLVEDKLRYTIDYAVKHSPFYRKWFERNGVSPSSIQSHEDLLELPLVSGELIRKNQPPKTDDFQFMSADWTDIYTIHETSGTSGVPKSFFLTWHDWLRYAKKYGRSFCSQGFGPGDRMVMCASYGMNIGANTMTLAARDVGMAVIPEGKCTFPTRIFETYRPTGIVASVFKLLRLARRLKNEGIDPKETSINKLIVGGESFADQSRSYLEEVWGCPVYNTYGSTEGTMCGECVEQNGLHVPEDLVHLDVYDPYRKEFLEDGECGRIVLTTLLSPGEKCGSLLINYDTEDTTVVHSRDKCACGRTHMRIYAPEREAESLWVSGSPFNRVDVEQGVFQRENMDHLTGEYEAFLDKNSVGKAVLKVNLECLDENNCDRDSIQENFLKGFLNPYTGTLNLYEEGGLDVDINFAGMGELEIFKLKGRPKRVVDRRKT
ncbi:coenzyme F390 synthetase [Methanococcoides burtonii]|uniref:Coenzyme F390 synthetase n=1 Tax=Methanococcoides burtonii (strain DSM 6242 / NBRC 107633 / OCM 468 / ACE-M) TaxID=259564 RepID=Q12YA3_METBU|nr:coenzyme F390 synthetase [Methanococcoides burtonii]ABE51573.1 Coenzyme F390 synthetase [Methanococcoides burtonii DSM 6242]